ncbi:MAG: alpha/beta hydrolase [Pseudomonadota bacterium]
MLDALGVVPENRVFMPADAPHVDDYAPRLRDVVSEGDIVCGFSLGSLILSHNLDALVKARAVVLLASNPLPDRPGNRPNREAVRDRVLSGDAKGWIADNWSTMSASPSESLRDFVVAMAEDTTPLITAQTELAASRPGAVDALAETDVPVLLVTGTADRQTPPAPLIDIAARARSAHLSTVDGLGHFALIEAPDRVAEAVHQGLTDLAHKIHLRRPVDDA